MKKFSKLPMRIQFLSLVLLLITIVPTLIIIFYILAKNVVIDQNIKHSTEISSILQQDVSERYADISNLMVYSGYHSSIIDFLHADTNLNRYHASQDVAELFQLINNTQIGIYDIYITDSKKHIYYMYGYNNIDLTPKCLEHKDGRIYYDGLAKINVYNSTSANVFVFSMNILSDGVKAPIGDRIGYITFLLDANFINLSAKKLPNLSNTDVFLIERDNKIFTSINHSALSLSKSDIESITNITKFPAIKSINGKKYLIQVHSIPEIDGKIITTTIYQDLISGIEKVRSICILLFIILLIVLSMLILIMLYNFINPLNRLLNFMSSINEGNLKMLKESVKLEGFPEIEAISEEFNQLLRQINTLNQQLFTTTSSLYQQEIEAQKLQNTHLQSQINPHFLFNTLDSIKGIALASQNQEIYKIASSFSSIFQYSTNSNEYASLKEELKAVGNFLSIISIRFSDRIQSEINCPEVFFNKQVPRMILQPIIEHTITHELEPLLEGGKLLIQVSGIDNNHYEICIIDNGIGMEEQNLLELNEALRTDDIMSVNKASCFDYLHSINLRIKIAYGNEYGISVKSNKGHGMQTCILLP